MKNYNFVLHFCLSLFSCSSFGQMSSPGISQLKKSGPYEHTTATDFPKFTYQDADSKDLSALRKKFALEKIAGNGTDVEKAINLLEWFHNEVPHDDEENLSILNANNIIDSYRTRKIMQGCYPLAIAMNEIFLAMGYKSRIVICFSSDYAHPNGGHVINSVYIDSLNKWVYMDPQDNVYVMDEDGNLLSVMEVRERLIAGGFVSINQKANYHQKPQTAKAYFEEFMGEHMFRFICPLSSSYGSETRTPGKILRYVELLPMGSEKPPMDKFETGQHKGVEVKNYHTSNDKAFWSAP